MERPEPFQHLIHVGFAKAGSTYFKAWLGQRSDVLHQYGGIAGLNGTRDLHRPQENSNQTVRAVVTSDESLLAPENFDYFGFAGETFDLAYKADLTAKCHSLYRRFPNATVLILARGFQTSFRSNYSQYLRWGGKLSPEEYMKMPQWQTILDMDFAVSLYENTFGTDHVTVLPYELLKNKQEDFVRALERCLNLPAQCVDVGHLNPSLSSERMLLAARLNKRSSALSKWLFRAYPESSFREAAVRVLEKIALPFGNTERQQIEFTIPEGLARKLDGKTIKIRDRDLFKPYAEHYSAKAK